MIQLANNIDSEELERMHVEQEERRKQESRLEYLKLSIQSEEEKLVELNNKIIKNKEQFKVAVILIIVSICIFVGLSFNAAPVLLLFIQNTLMAILILGIIVNIIAYTVRLAVKTIPMYFWCKKENEGVYTIHDNYVRQYKEHQRILKEMKDEHEMLINKMEKNATNRKDLNDTYKMAKNVTNFLEKNFGNKIQDVDISNVEDDRNHRTFSIKFKAYNYFIVWFNYDMGLISCSIQHGEESFVRLKNSQKSYENANFDIFCKELQEQLELRIPDKFLEANGWK